MADLKFGHYRKRIGATHDAGLKARLYNGSVAKAL
jgi:hypothetical protein